MAMHLVETVCAVIDANRLDFVLPLSAQDERVLRHLGSTRPEMDRCADAPSVVERELDHIYPMRVCRLKSAWQAGFRHDPCLALARAQLLADLRRVQPHVAATAADDGSDRDARGKVDVAIDNLGEHVHRAVSYTHLTLPTIYS